MSDQVVVLVAGKGCDAAAKAAAKVAGVSKVVKVDADEYAHALAENLAPLIAKLAANYSHVVAPATTTGKNIMPRAAALLRQIANGLYEAHIAQMTHRDLKPDNILLTHFRGYPNFVKILDFGIAKLKDTDTPNAPKLTQAGIVYGTP